MVLNKFIGNGMPSLSISLKSQDSYNQSMLIPSSQNINIQRKLLKDNGITSFSKVVSPLPMHLKLFTHEGDLFSDPTHYKKLAAKLNFLSHARPDLSYTIQNPQLIHATTQNTSLTCFTTYFELCAFHLSSRHLIAMGK